MNAFLAFCQHRYSIGQQRSKNGQIFFNVVSQFDNSYVLKIEKISALCAEKEFQILKGCSFSGNDKDVMILPPVDNDTFFKQVKCETFPSNSHRN